MLLLLFVLIQAELICKIKQNFLQFQWNMLIMLLVKSLILVNIMKVNVQDSFYLLN